MRKIAYLLIVATITASMIGCGRSDGTPAEQVRAKCEKARVELNKAADLIKTTTVKDLSKSDASEQLFQLAAKAEGILNDALALDAGDGAKASAYAMLAEVKSVVSTALLNQAREMELSLIGGMGDMDAAANAVAGLEAEQSFVEELAKASTEQNADQTDIAELAASIKAGMMARTENLEKTIEAMKAELSDLQARVQDLSEKAEPLRREAVELRRRMVRTAGEASLALDAKASELEKQYAELQDKINALLLTVDNKQAALAIAEGSLVSMKNGLASVSDTIERLVTRKTTIADELEAIQGRLTEARGMLEVKVQSLTESFKAVAEKLREAIVARDAAAGRLSSAARSVRNQASQAGQIKRDNPNSAVSELLNDMSSRSAGADIIADQARAALATANLRRELLENAGGVQAFFTMRGVPQSLLDDAPQVAEKADADYASAIENFERAASMVPNDIRWIMDTGRAKALFGRYRLSVQTGKPDRQLLQQATDVLQTVLTPENAQNPDYMSAVAVLNQIKAESTRQ